MKSDCEKSMKIVPGWSRWRTEQLFFLKKRAQVRSQSVHRKAGGERRCRPVAGFPILPTLLICGAILSGPWLVEGGSIDLPEQDDRGREASTGFTTAPQTIEWRVGGQAIMGQVTLTLLEAHPEDDTLRSSLRVALIRNSRGSRLSSQRENTLGPFTQEVRANWQKGTSCPTLHLRIPNLELPAERTPISIPSFLIKVEETEAEVPQLLCSWTRQINAGRSRLGILRALNRILLPPTEVSLDLTTTSPISIGDLDF